MCAFSYAWSLPDTWQRRRSHHLIHHIQKPHATRKVRGSLVFGTGVIADVNWTLHKWRFSNFLLLWPWTRPDDLHIRTWPVFSGDTPNVQMWTSYVNAFESYRLTDRLTYIHTEDRHTHTTEIIGYANNAASQMVKNNSPFSITCDKDLNILVHGIPTYVTVYRNCKILKMVRFWPTVYISPLQTLM